MQITIKINTIFRDLLEFIGGLDVKQPITD